MTPRLPHHFYSPESAAYSPVSSHRFRFEIAELLGCALLDASMTFAHSIGLVTMEGSSCSVTSTPADLQVKYLILHGKIVFDTSSTDA